MDKNAHKAKTPGTHKQAKAAAQRSQAQRQQPGPPDTMSKTPAGLRTRDCAAPAKFRSGDLPSTSRHQLVWEDKAVIRIIRTNHCNELMNHQTPAEHYGGFNKENNS